MATVVDTTALWQTIVAALVAGIGITSIFSIGIFAIARFVELGRDGRNVMAVAFGAMAAAAMVAVGGAIVLGVIVMTSK